MQHVGDLTRLTYLAVPGAQSMRRQLGACAVGLANQKNDGPSALTEGTKSQFAGGVGVVVALSGI